MQQTIEGYFDGERIIPLQPIAGPKHYRLQITILEEISPDEEVRLRAFHSNAFDFWEDPREDIYQDYLKAE